MEFQRKSIGLGLIPTAETISAFIGDVVGTPLRACGFSKERFDAVQPFYQKLDYDPSVYLLINDATAVLPGLGYRMADDSVHGLAISDDDLGVLDVRAGESLAQFLKRFHSFKLATQVEIVLLAPLKPRLPPYILGVFAQSGSQTAETVERRLRIAREEMEQRGALIMGWAADGASAHFKLMRQMRQIAPGAPTIDFVGPTLSSDRANIRTPARCVTWRGAACLVPSTPLLDPVHLVNLLRNAPLRKAAALQIGACTVDLNSVHDFLAEKMTAFGMEAQLGVRLSDFNTADRMDFAAAQRLFSTKVLSYLEANCTDVKFRGTVPPPPPPTARTYFRQRQYCSCAWATACCDHTSILTSSPSSASSSPSTLRLCCRRGTRTSSAQGEPRSCGAKRRSTHCGLRRTAR